MMAVILAGGKGTRLRPFTTTIPKPLLPLGDVPILEVVLRQLAAAGFRRVVLTLGHLPHLFSTFFGDGSRLGLELEYCTEETPLGTAGSLRLVKDPGEHLLVMNGDLLTTLDYRALVDDHIASGAAGTITLQRREVKIDFGVVVDDANGDLLEYREKPRIDYHVSMGINVLRREALAHIPDAGPFDMPNLMLALQSAGKRVRCVRTTCYWQDIGRFDDYQRASEDFEADPKRFVPG